MTLNQLALEMWERLGYQGVDPSVLSRVLKGERLFTFRQLEVFCETLSLSGRVHLSLRECLYVDMCSRMGLEGVSFSGRRGHLLDSVEDNIEKIRQVRLVDSPYLAYDWATSLYEVIHDQFKLEKSRVKRDRWLELLAKLIVEKIKLNLGISYSKDLRLSVADLSDELKNIGSALSNKNIIGNAHAFKGAVNYVLGNYQKAIEDYNEALKLIESISDKQFPLRILALCFAYENDKENFSYTRNEILQNLESFPLYDQCELFEALGRGEALLGASSSSIEMLQKGWCAYQQLELAKPQYKVARKIQLTRTQIEIAALLEDKSSLRNIESIGNEAIMLSNQFGYRTYVEKISNLLHRTLN